MQLIPAATVPQSDRDIVFRYSRARALIAYAVIGFTIAGLIVFGRIHHAWIFYYIAAVLVLALLLFQKLLIARFRPTNWLARGTDHGLFIKFRSYLNDHFPEEYPTAVFIPYAEIRAAIQVKQRRDLPDRNGRRTTMSARRIVELELAADTRQLAIVLANESALVFGKANYSGKRISTRYRHMPVRLGRADRLRIEWGVVPGVENFMTLLTRHTLVRPPVAVSENLADLDGLSREEQESRLRELAQSGDKIPAVTLARRLYGYDLTKAKEFVEALARAGSTER